MKFELERKGDGGIGNEREVGGKGTGTRTGSGSSARIRTDRKGEKVTIIYY